MRHATRVLAAAAVACSIVGVALAAPPRTGTIKAPQVRPRIGSIDANTDAARLAALLAGPGVSIGNARFVGDALAAGTFVNAQADIGLPSGVVLSTGRVSDLAGPNEFDDLANPEYAPILTRMCELVGAVAGQPKPLTDKQRGFMHAVWAKHGGDDARKAAISRLTSGRTDSSSELTADEVSALMDLTAELDKEAAA